MGAGSARLRGLVSCPGSTRRYTGKLVFAQVIEHLPPHIFRRCVQRYGGERHVKRFTCQDQLMTMPNSPSKTTVPL